MASRIESTGSISGSEETGSAMGDIHEAEDHSGLAVAPSRPEERSSLGEDGPKGSTHGAETEDPAQEDTSPQEQPSSGEADEDEDEDPAENLLFGYADNDDDPEEESPRDRVAKWVASLAQQATLLPPPQEPVYSQVYCAVKAVGRWHRFHVSYNPLRLPEDQLVRLADYFADGRIWDCSWNFYAVRTPFGGMHLLLRAQDVVNALAALSQVAKLNDLPLTDTFQKGLLFSFDGIDAPVPMWVGSSRNAEEKVQFECLEGQPWEEPCWDDWVSQSDPETRNIYLARLDASLRASHPLTIAGLTDLDKAQAYLGLVPLNRVEDDNYLDVMSKNDINGFLQRLVDEAPIFVSLRATGFNHEPVTRFDEPVAELGVALLDTRLAGTARDGDLEAECRMPIHSLHLRQEEHPSTRFDFGETEVVKEWHCEERLKAFLHGCCVENGVPRHTVVVVSGDWVSLQGIYELPVKMLSIPQMAAVYEEGRHKTLEALLGALGFSQSTDNPGNEAWLILAAMVRMAVMKQVPQ